MENTHNFIMPQTNLVGVGAIKDLPNELLSWKLKKALIVTDKNMITFGYVQNVEKILKSLFISYDIFDGILHPDSTVSFVEDGLGYFNKGINKLKRDYNFVISIGGGTNHDCAKAIATVAANGGTIIDYEGYNKVTKPILPLITINTTGGSGAEVSMFVIVIDESRKAKVTCGSPKMIPYISVNDPIFMTTMPKEVTASSGMDAITHAIESSITTEASPITDSLALEALRLAFTYLPRAYENGNDLEAREKMMYAGMIAGMSFNNSGLGYVHCLSHQLGGAYHQNHGDYNAVLLPHVFEFNASSVPSEKIFRICEAIGLKASRKSEAVDNIIQAIKKLSSSLGIPDNLKEMGLQEEDIEYCSQNAIKDISALVNPRQGTVEDIMNLYKAAM